MIGLERQVRFRSQMENWEKARQDPSPGSQERTFRGQSGSQHLTGTERNEHEDCIQQPHGLRTGTRCGKSQPPGTMLQQHGWTKPVSKWFSSGWLEEHVKVNASYS